jgi:peptide/nickel transport system ATP-binding protein
MTAPLLRIENLRAVSGRDGGVQVLRGVSLQVSPGEVLGLVGESGAGKSTIAKAILGILPRAIRLTAGRILYEGRDLLELPARELSALLGSSIALIPQDPATALNPSRRVGAQLTDGLRLKRGLTRAGAKARGLELLAEVHIADPARVMRSFPHELSGGQRQRVLIAAAFALEPQLIVADEPTTALDVTVQKQILRLIRRLQRDHGTAVIFVTHNLGVVAQICDRVSLLFMGKVIEEGRTVEVLAHPAHAYTQALLEASPRYDLPDRGLKPVPDEVIAALRREVVGHG